MYKDKQYHDLIAQLSRKILKKSAYDAAHDYKHHKAVAENCLKIIRTQKFEKINSDLLLSAAYWHDFERGTENDYKKVEKDYSDLVSILKSAGIPSGYLHKVIKLIDEHTYNNEQNSLEGMILFDADKLEYVSLRRFKDANKRLSQDKIDYYKELYKNRINSVKDRLFFESSKKLFGLRLKRLKKYIEKEHPDLLDWVSGV